MQLLSEQLPAGEAPQMTSTQSLVLPRIELKLSLARNCSKVTLSFSGRFRPTTVIHKYIYIYNIF